MCHDGGVGQKADAPESALQPGEEHVPQLVSQNFTGCDAGRDRFDEFCTTRQVIVGRLGVLWKR
jgi:hypothetical protein